MSNAAGRLLGTILSGVLYQYINLQACLWTSGVLLIISGFVSYNIKEVQHEPVEKMEMA